MTNGLIDEPPQMDKLAEELLGFLISIRDEGRAPHISKVIEDGLKHFCPAEYAWLDKVIDPHRKRMTQ